MKVDAKKQVRDIAVVFGAIMTSHGLTAYLPVDMSPVLMVVGGLVVTAVAMEMK